MANQELKSLSRADLLELLVEMGKENDRLRAELQQANWVFQIPSMDIEGVDSVTEAELEAELGRQRARSRFRKVLASTVGVLAVVSAAAVLVATLLMPVLQIYGDSMSSTLYDGDIVVSVSTNDLATGDVVAFYYNNQILVKRVIAQAGDWVDIADDGAVSVDGKQLDEPYVTDSSLGNCNIELPYQVPESRVFVMGDHRSVSVDSRNSAVGCVSEEQIVGKLVLRIWPLAGFGAV